MNADFVNPFIISLLNVLETMAQIKLQVGKPKRKTTALAQGDVSGLIGMVGDNIKGSMSITFEEGLALDIMQGMLGERPDTLDAEVSDMVGEITNMVAGGAKKELAKKGYDIGMATPMVVSGPEHTINHKVSGHKMIMPFKGEGGKAYIEICFDK
ncbi:MAG: chemotaxis protein CheX [Alteromonadaceae bacterium]|nr:chemotaxis protein CheX [Alteromonadaceae bacterium]